MECTRFDKILQIHNSKKGKNTDAEFQVVCEQFSSATHEEIFVYKHH